MIMALDPGSGAIAGSPESSGRDSPIPRQWRNQLGGEETPSKDKAYRRYAAGVEKTLALFETALEEWADYISFLNKLLKSLQARPPSIHLIPTKALVAKRLSQCLNPALPSGVHQKTLELYNYVFTTIGTGGLSRDLPLYLPGLAPTLSFASLSVRSPYLDLLETHFLDLDPRSLRPAMRSIILALLPGLEDEMSEDFDRTLHLVARFKEAIRPRESRKLGEHHASGDDFFWQCFFLAAITSHSRRSGALAYLVRYFPKLGPTSSSGAGEEDFTKKLHAMVTSPEPGLLVRCFASGLGDEQLLIQRGFLDLLVSHVPLNSNVLQTRVKPADLELLVKAAVGVVARRDMSLNRRLWAWLLGPEPTGPDADHNEQTNVYPSSRTTYFEDYGLQPLTRALLHMIQGASRSSSAERNRPYRICLSLMDRWEIGGLVVPEVFMPVIDSVRRFQAQAASKAEFDEVLRSASVFFDGIESGLIYSEIVGLLAQAIGPGNLTLNDRMDRLALVNFIVTNFNVREEEMVTIHAPLTCLAALFMLEDSKHHKTSLTNVEFTKLCEQVLGAVVSLLDLIPERAFPQRPEHNGDQKDTTALPSTSDAELLKKIKTFYVHEQGNLESSSPPFTSTESGELLLEKAVMYICDDSEESPVDDIAPRVRLLTQILSKTSANYHFDSKQLLSHLHTKLTNTQPLSFSHFSSLVQLSTHLHATGRIETQELSDLVGPLVRHAWSYLSASKPKYHVEAVRCLWQLQTALTLSGRELEAAICGILAKPVAVSQRKIRSADNERTFSVLWSHSLQDTSSERRSSKSQILDQRQVPRLSGTDHYMVMLTQPAFLILDALLDDRTQTYMIVKSWLDSMVGIDRLFLIFVVKMAQLPFLNDVTSRRAGDKVNSQPTTFTEDDDLDLCLYYLRTLHNVLDVSGDVCRAVLASKYVSFSDDSAHIRAGAEEDEMMLQEFFVRVCMRCVTGERPFSPSHELDKRVSQLHRYALTVLHQFLSSRYAAPLSTLELHHILIDKLSQSISTSDPYVQVLLLDVVHDTVKLRDIAIQEAQPAEALEKRPTSAGSSRRGHSPFSFSSSEIKYIGQSVPPGLLKCLQVGLSSPNSQAVLDSWVSFLGKIITLYSHSIFQTVIPLVETLCKHIAATFSGLRSTFQSETSVTSTTENTPESTLIYLLNGLEQVLAVAHDQLLAEEARAQSIKGPEQPSSLFGSMVSGVFQTEGPQQRSATANDRLTVHLAFQDAMRVCYTIWSWGQGDDSKKQDVVSSASFGYTSLRMRNRARRLMEHLFTAEALECLETVIDIWQAAGSDGERRLIFNFLSSLDACRPRHSIPALFNAIYSRTNPSALDPSRKSTLTISLQDSDLVVFLVEYSRSLEDDAMDEIWQDCMTFLKDLLGNPFPHRQTLPSLLEFAAILGSKVDNTTFGEQKRMRRELGDIFLRLLAALFTTRPLTFTEPAGINNAPQKYRADDQGRPRSTRDGPDDVVAVLASVVPNLPKILLEPDRVLSAAGTISINAIGPTLRSKTFPDTVTSNTLRLFQELSRLQNNQKTWKKDVGDAFNENRFFGMNLTLVKDGWLPLLKQWIHTDKERMAEIIARISAPTTAGIVFGVGATSARLEADRKTQLNLRRVATLVLAAADDGFVTELPTIFDKLVELLAATSTSSPSSTTRADVYMVLRALALKSSPMHLAMMWPVVNAEIHAAISSVVAADHSAASDMYLNTGVLQACKLLDLLICVAPDDFQLHEWLFITDTIEAVHRSATYQPVALVDELSEELGISGAHTTAATTLQTDTEAHVAASGPYRRPLLGPGGISDDVSLDRKDELVAKILRPFFGQLSIYAFESTYAMGSLDREACIDALLKDLFDERTMVRAL